MPNRFARRIKDGSIETPEELKAEFKALAKATHPDLAGPAFAHEFARIREEYEAALRDFGRHRFGLRSGRRAPGPERDASADGVGGAGPGSFQRGGVTATRPGVRNAFAALAVLRKRGFPKKPRHEKETLRYEYARWCCERALAQAGEGLADALLAFERAAVARGCDTAALRYLDELAEYAALGLPALRTALLVDLGSLRADARIGSEALALIDGLSALLGIGAAFPSAT